MNIFTPSLNDQSIFYLSQLFSTMGTILVPPAGLPGPDLLPKLFGVFNNSLLILAVFIIIYTTVVGVLKTAQEGEFLGKQWGSMWTPIRMVIGIAGLTPMTAVGGSTGYCLIQFLVMWLIIQGVGAADTLWTAALNYVGGNGKTAPSTTTQSSVIDQELQGIGQSRRPPVPSALANAMSPIASSVVDINNLFESLLCQAKLYASGTPSYYCYYYKDPPVDPASQSNSFCVQSADEMWDPYGSQYQDPPPATPPNITAVVPNPDIYGTYKMGLEGVCGSLYLYPPTATPTKKDTDANGNAVAGTDYYNELIAQAQANAYKAIIPSFRTTIDKIVGADQELENWLITTNEVYKSPPEGLTKDEYNAMVDEGLANIPVPSYVQQYCDVRGYEGQGCLMQVQRCCDPIKSNGSLTMLYWPYLLDDSDKKVLTNAYNTYNTSMTQALTTITDENLTQTNTSIAGVNGWMLAGAFFYGIAKKNNTVSLAAGASSSETPAIFQTLPGSSVFSTLPEEIKKSIDQTIITIAPQMSNFLMLVQQGVQNTAGAAVTNGTFDCNMGSGLTQSDLGFKLFYETGFSGPNGTMCSAIAGWMETLTGGTAGQAASATGHPLVTMQAFGENLLISIQVIFGVMMAVIAVLGVVTSIQVLGSGSSSGLSSILNFISIPFLFLMGALFTFASSLAVYIPLIPYILFTFGAINWLIATIEAMLAAPILAIGIMTPEGGHEIWGKASPAFMLLFNILLRPSLMVFAMMTSILFSYIVVDFINSAFLGAIYSVSSGMRGGPLEAILFMMLYTGLIISAMNKVFALIHLIPDNVLRWIGGGREQFGEGGGAEAVKGSFEAGAGQASGAMAGATSRGLSSAKESAGKAKEAETKKGESQQGLNVSGGGGGGEGEGGRSRSNAVTEKKEDKKEDKSEK